MEKKNFLNFANSFQAVAKPGLENIKALMNNLNNPQKALRFIHIAGTNGKGSVCAFLQCIFSAAGYKTGKYISPNLISVCERISINGENISEKELEKIMEKVKCAADAAEAETGVYPTQFELWTAAAFVYFKERAADIVILETGLGGEKDATNIIDFPLCSVITKIAADHKEYLGEDISAIAAAKAGIIKKGGFTVSANQSLDALKVIKKRCEETENRLIVPPMCENIRFNKEGLFETFDYSDMKNLKVKLLGVHQTENAAEAAEAARNLGIEEKYIREGLFATKNPARFEIISKNPEIIFDGAHNPNGVEALCKALKRYFPERKISFVTAAMADKDIKENINILKKYGFENSKVQTLEVKNNPRSATAEALAKVYKDAGFSAYPEKSFKSALKNIKNDEVTVVFGSLYLYKDVCEEA